MNCPRCGTAGLPETKFCKNCGAPMGAASSAQPAAAPQPATPAAYPAAYPGAPTPPPGMVPVVYQATPGGPQQVYYMPAQGAQAHGAGGVLAGLNAEIRKIAATDELEGFSLKDTFGQAFSRHSEEEINDYLVTGSPRTTPPLELVQTDWPKPWMFFRILAVLAVAYAAFYGLFLYSQNSKSIPAIMVLGTFAVPLASLMLVWELNTPRNMSIITVLRFVIVGGGCSIVITMLAYLVPFLSGDNILIPGFVEETAKILAVVIVTWGATSRRYPYQLNGILIGCAVGSGFACIETLGYGLDAYSQTLIQLIGQAQNGTPLAPIFAAATTVMVDHLTMRGVLAPFGHVVWCAISAGALWRVKGDKPVSFAMLLDGRFLGAFAIVMAMHDLWDISIAFPNSAFLNSTAGQACGWIITGAISWYVLFTMVQQGLHQVRDMKKAQLEHTVAHVEATLGLGTKRYPMQPQAPAGV
jgi:RsiW-degrading membrane proteinase PrsW (M82 family)